MDEQTLLEEYPNNGRVRERLYTWERNEGKVAREGTIEGTSLGGATKQRGNRFMLNVHVKWDDGTESTIHHTVLEPIDV